VCGGGGGGSSKGKRPGFGTEGGGIGTWDEHSAIIQENIPHRLNKKTSFHVVLKGPGFGTDGGSIGTWDEHLAIIKRKHPTSA
jgi:hypothetical protein